MTQIDIPFSREMAIAAVEGRKIATTRSERKGEPGDEFQILGARFRLIAVWKIRLEIVRYRYFRLEGFDSPEAFEETWKALHRGHFTARKIYHIHFFGRIA